MRTPPKNEETMPKLAPPSATKHEELAASPLGRVTSSLVTFARHGMVAVPLAASRATVVGRAPQCDLRLDSLLLSRTHFAVHAGATITIEDLGSSNGTKVNGVRLAPRAPVPLDAGSLVEAGGSFFLVCDEALPERLDGERAAKTSCVVELGSRGLFRAPIARAPGVRRAHGAIVADPAMVRLHELVERVAATDVAVLVLGESGAGKEVIARAVHGRSPRAAAPFVTINCAALSEASLESELFGVECGAPGATQVRPGLIESADKGTLFLDAIDAMPLATQEKLARVIAKQELLRIGASEPRAIDVRFVAATSQRVSELVVSGGFSRDLYAHINGITLPVPPLRERRADIAPLATMFLAQAAERAGRPAPILAPEVRSFLAAYPWPGNVRELRNVIERALTLSSGSIVRCADILFDRDATLPPAAESEPSVEGSQRVGSAASGFLRGAPNVA
jgi:hypothetical protein